MTTDEKPPELMSEADRALMAAAAMPAGEAVVDMSELALRSLGVAGAPEGADGVAPAEPVDELVAICDANWRRILELRRDRQRLALEALTDKKAAKALDGVERELGYCEAQDERLLLARGEREERERAASEAALAEARAEALDQARELGENRRNMTKLVDAAARAFAHAVADFRGVVELQGDQLRAAGRRQPPNEARMIEYALEQALAHALRDAGVRDSFEIRSPNLSHMVPLVEGDPAPALGATDAG